MGIFSEQEVRTMEEWERKWQRARIRGYTIIAVALCNLLVPAIVLIVWTTMVAPPEVVAWVFSARPPEDLDASRFTLTEEQAQLSGFLVAWFMLGLILVLPLACAGIFSMKSKSAARRMSSVKKR
jgi:hypothetical protein